MKASRHFFVFYILFAAAFSLIGCATTPEKSAIKEAEDIDFDPVPPQPVGDIEKLCYIISKEHSWIFTVSGVDRPLADIRRNELVIVTPGRHQLIVQYIEGNRSSGPVSILFDFEEGENYYLNYEITKSEKLFSPASIQFFITELTDQGLLERIDNSKMTALADYEANYIAAVENYQTSVEKLNNFLVFSQANPAWLEGVWDRQKAPGKPMQLTFKGDRVTFSRTTDFKLFTYIYEGHYYFNEDTIIVYFENMSVNGGEPKNYPQPSKYVWHYELKNGGLNILKAPWLDADSLDGPYRKNN
jgi:hypothetical protein